MQTAHEIDRHPMPKRWLKRYRHRLYICYCGRAFTTRHDYWQSAYYWQEWSPK
jgi:hypothetical protein